MQLEHISYFIPQQRLALRDMADLSKMNDAEIRVMEKFMGLEFVPRNSNRTPYDNLLILLHQFLSECELKKQHVKYLLFAPN